MYYVIDEITNLTDGGLYVLVSFWTDKASCDKGDPPAAVNDFQFPNLRATSQRVVTDGRGWLKRSDDVFVDPSTVDWDNEPRWAMESYDVDIVTMVRAAIAGYWERRANALLVGGDTWPRDHSDKRIIRTQTDPRGLRSQAVRDEVGVGRQAALES